MAPWLDIACATRERSCGTVPKQYLGSWYKMMMTVTGIILKGLMEIVYGTGGGTGGDEGGSGGNNDSDSDDDQYGGGSYDDGSDGDHYGGGSHNDDRDDDGMLLWLIMVVISVLKLTFH